MPFYSPDDQTYRDRVHRNGREVDQSFDPEESLFRRFPKAGLLHGKPVALTTISFAADSGISVNRSKYSEPQDVLEPDCCNGVYRPECVVLDIHNCELPQEIAATDNTGRVFRFRMVHRPGDTCFAHSEVWCNQQGDVHQAYEEPPKHVKNLFRGEVARQLAKRDVLEFRKNAQ